MPRFHQTEFGHTRPGLERETGSRDQVEPPEVTHGGDGSGLNEGPGGGLEQRADLVLNVIFRKKPQPVSEQKTSGFLPEFVFPILSNYKHDHYPPIRSFM